MRQPHQLSRVAVCLLVALVVLAGCGGKDKRAFAPLSDCELKLENTAAANVVRRAFAAGKLGSADHVQSTYFRHEARDSWLDSSGNVRPLAKLKGDTRWDFSLWMAAIEGNAGKVGDDMFAARMHARHHSSCKSLTD
jgi:hypothetical protein